NETAYMIALSSRGGPPSFFLSFTDGALAPADLSARSKSRAGQSSAPRRRRKGEGRNGEPARAAVHQGGRVSATGGVSLDGPRPRARRNARRASGEVERSRGAFALLFVSYSVLRRRGSSARAGACRHRSDPSSPGARAGQPSDWPWPLLRGACAARSAQAKS